MPFVQLKTSLSSALFTEQLLHRLSACVAATLGKPAERMHLEVLPGLPMLMAGSTAPCINLSVSAIGATSTAEQNKQHSAKIFEFLTQELGLSQDRISILFYPLEAHQIGKKGTVMSFL